MKTLSVSPHERYPVCKTSFRWWITCESNRTDPVHQRSGVEWYVENIELLLDQGKSLGLIPTLAHRLAVEPRTVERA